MNSRLLFFAFLLLFPFVTAAQAPGYMGKKLVVRYENSFMQTYSQPTSKGRSVTAYGTENSFFSFNSTHSLGADYVTGRKRTFGVSFKYLKTGAITSNNSHGYPVSYPYGIITGYGFGISTKRFNKKFIAPWGLYREFEVFVLRHNLEHFYPAKYYPIKPKPIEYPTFTNAGFSFSFGKQRIIKDAITINYGAKLGILLKKENYSEYDAPELTEEERNIKARSGNRLFRHQLINITFGVGFLR